MIIKDILTKEERKEISKEKRRAWDRNRHFKDKEKRNKSRREIHANNPERLRKIWKENYAKDPNKVKYNNIKCKYGEKALKEYHETNTCESCGIFIEGKDKFIDHNHVTGKFRGILCFGCNFALGHLKEKESAIIGLLKYYREKCNFNNQRRTKMKTFNEQAAQGDMFIRVIDKLPDNVKQTDAEKGNFVLAHSETGHNHVVKKQDGVTFYASNDDAFVAYLVVDTAKVKENVECKHLRDHDTHETISFFTGDFFSKIKDAGKKIFEIRRQREYTPEGFRRAQD